MSLRATAGSAAIYYMDCFATALLAMTVRDGIESSLQGFFPSLRGAKRRSKPNRKIVIASGTKWNAAIQKNTKNKREYK
ncbi:hypothetical protein BKN38_07780 [Helicobacter sp. CLO-3]|uniref:hypothetical protein n=1 Tax=Helicobacter sp. CLO-3 TaxID=211 RepID=UPI000805B010|nr:hypothetical protein [Helicobacter sp. CLO-3]OBV28821.1 hypothetical protein BA723_08110 [Helicobacter sp. CLO-3]OHU82042.1 hypothetical protein BKN38_07780 [Helicobacter sp. CLO-3]